MPQLLLDFEIAGTANVRKPTLEKISKSKKKNSPGRPFGKLNTKKPASGCFYYQDGKRWTFHYHKRAKNGDWRKTSKVVPPAKIDIAKLMKANGSAIQEILNFIST